MYSYLLASGGMGHVGAAVLLIFFKKKSQKTYCIFFKLYTYYFRWHDPCPGASYLRWYEKWHLSTSSSDAEGIQAFSSKLGTFSGKLGTPRQRRRTKLS